MADIKAGRWALLSDGNIDNLTKFFQGCREQACETKGVVVCPPESHQAINAARLDWPAGWGLCKSGSLWRASDQWFGILWDDQCPEYPRWDVLLIEHVQPWNVVTSLEAINGDWRRGAVCWGVECLKTRGLNIDDINQELVDWSRAARETQCWYLEKIVQLPRRIGPPEGVLKLNDTKEHVAKLSALMARYGVVSINPSWEGISLHISTPSGASRPEALYMISMFSTMEMLKAQGTPVQWALERYNADIGLARSHMFSEFVRSQYTHLLMIDDDMSWETSAIHRLIYANKPLVAVAGPKKRLPLVFAVSHVDESGKPAPLITDQATGCAEVTSVGAAFMMIRRDCAEAMVKAYPELEYIGSDGKTSWGLFCQTVENRAYLPEDFSFCRRWRKIGGHVYICPDVPLGHIGAHEFKGDLMSNAFRQGQEFK